MGNLRNTLQLIQKRIAATVKRSGRLEPKQSAELKSSATEYTWLPEFCAKIAADPALLANFRRDPAVTGVVETLDYKSAKDIPAMIARQTPHYRELYPSFCENDRCGNPERYDFDGVGRIAPTTLRYVKVLSDLECTFGSLDQLSVVEIGGGYGGQCALIKKRFSVSKYTIVDLPSVLGLSQAYLNHFHLTDVVFQPWEQLESIPCDLFISSYALSELRRDVQEFYFDRVIAHAKKGYVLWNLCGNALGSMTAREFANRIPGAVLIENQAPLLKIDITCKVGLVMWGV